MTTKELRDRLARLEAAHKDARDRECCYECGSGVDYNYGRPLAEVWCLLKAVCEKECEEMRRGIDRCPVCERPRTDERVESFLRTLAAFDDSDPDFVEWAESRDAESLLVTWRAHVAAGQPFRGSTMAPLSSPVGME